MKELAESVADQKDRMRKHYKNLRERLTEEDVIKKSKKIERKILNLEDVKRAEHIMLYYSIYNEVNTIEIIEELLESGKKVYLPYTIKAKNEIKAAEIENLRSDLKKGSYGIMEPVDRKNCDLDKLQIVVVPGLAFTDKGDRLGYGGGYYDRFLSKLDEKVLTLALIYDFMVLDSLPVSDHDQQVKMVISEKKIYNNK